MAFERPTLKQLASRAGADIQTNLTGSVAALRRSVESVLAKVIAGAAHQQHGHIVYLSKQILPDTAGEEMLLRHARGKVDPPRKQASFASGRVTLTGVDGTPVPADTLLSGANGFDYRTAELATVASGSCTVDVTATKAGLDGNVDSGFPLVVGTPIAGLDSEGTVSSTDGLTGGADLETIEELRSRVLARQRRPPSGGGPGDYEAWAKEVPGVTRAWEKPGYNGAGTVGLFCVRDNESPINPSISEVNAIREHIETKAPVTAVVNVYSPELSPVDISLSLQPDTPEVRAAAEAQLEHMFQRDSEPGATIRTSRLGEAVSLAADETYHEIISPAVDVEHLPSQLPVLGTITWVSDD